MGASGGAAFITLIRFMEYKIIASDNFKPVNWSGGTTTELFIFPLKAGYHQRNFQFRLSKSTVETDKSDFTSLPGVSRKLMVLSGKITLCHEGHHSRQLNKFEVDEFEGDCKTSSVGKCTDFNLMTAGKTTGDLQALVIKKKQFINYEIKKNCEWLFIYIYSGIVSIDINNEMTTVSKNDLLVLNKLTIKNLEINGIEYSELVFSVIS